MRIQFHSLHGQSEIDVVDLGLRFKDGEVKDVSSAAGSKLLGNPNFVEVTDAVDAAPSWHASSIDSPPDSQHEEA